jgi:DNA-binding MarR family transcriptional regulator
MLSAETFETIEVVCRTLRKSTLPFGGLQVVLVGDFFQLPPIVRRAEPSSQMEFMDIDPDTTDDGTPFAFRSTAWRTLDPTICYLSEQHRQEDADFLDALSALRRGQITDEVRACFNKRTLTDITKLDQKVTKLFPHNANVDSLNDLELSKLPSDTRVFKMLGRGAPPLIESLKRSCLSPENLVLKVGAKVMLTKNSPDGKYVNGTTGEIVGFSIENQLPEVRLRSGKVLEISPAEWAITEGEHQLATISQLPLRLAWAITVHKSQGMSLDAALIDLRRAFEYGQGYVALSRVRSLDGLHLLGFNERALEVHPAVLSQDSYFRSASDQAERHYQEMTSAKLGNLQQEFLNSCYSVSGFELPKQRLKGATYQTTRDLLIKDKLSIEEIAQKRGMTTGTIISHIEKLVEDGGLSVSKDLVRVKPDSASFEVMMMALVKVKQKEGQMLLSQTRELLGSKYSFDQIRLARLFLR